MPGAANALPPRYTRYSLTINADLINQHLVHSISRAMHPVNLPAIEGVEKEHRLNALTPAPSLSRGQALAFARASSRFREGRLSTKGEEDMYRSRLINGI